MSIPSEWRGCAAYFRQPGTDVDGLAAQNLFETVYFFNCRERVPPLADIEYRSSDEDQDILHHVFRWDTRCYTEIFQNGFDVWLQRTTPDDIFFDLDHYVHEGGRLLDSNRLYTHAFVSTTLNSSFYPETEITKEVYRYEIYAPGGIWVAETFVDDYKFSEEDEIAFVAGIAPQYIRSAQLFRISPNPRSGDSTIATRVATTATRVDDIIRVNANFNPRSHPSSLLCIKNPVFECLHNDGRRVPLTMSIYRPQVNYEVPLEKQEVSDDAIDWYSVNVANVTNYITAAFRAYGWNEAYLFMKNEYVLLNYDPGTIGEVINGPLYIRDGFDSLVGTTFGEYGIDCAFDIDYSQSTEAFIFSGNFCTCFDYDTTNERIVKVSIPITTFFPFFKETVFQSGIDAAFKARASEEAYLFKGDQYALINFGDPNRPGSGHLIGGICKITERFPSLRNTIFETGFDAALASHSNEDEAYLFKGDQYILINYGPGTTDDYIVGCPEPILSNWPSLSDILPRNNRGLDVHDHVSESDHRIRDNFDRREV
ncbi:hypothetical protein REPUB_Repub03eG0230800 [Reevesia pubescens]